MTVVGRVSCTISGEKTTKGIYNKFNMKLMLLVMGIFSMALADVKKGEYVKQEKKYYKEEKHSVSYNKQYAYHGKYLDKCDKDGFYYKNEKSFVICSNNNAYVQPCAPGSRNSPYEKYNSGKAYYYRDFCDVNLVDHGYAAKHYGYDKKAPHYEVSHSGYDKKAPHYKLSHSKPNVYHGKYGGVCDKDGFYYNGDDSFVICSNNNAYVQSCAPGTRNSAFNYYYPGSEYLYRDFCDVNLVDHGYGVHYGYGSHGYGGFDKPYYGEYPRYGKQEQYGGYYGHEFNAGYAYGR